MSSSAPNLHARNLPIGHELHVALGVTFFNISRVQEPDPALFAPDEVQPPATSYVEFAPIEVDPFRVRCEFQWVVYDDGREERWLAKTPTLVPAPEVLAPITPTLQRTLEEHSRRYQRIAECMIELDIDGATRFRAAMLEGIRNRKPRERITDLYLLDLGLEFSARVEEYGSDRGLIDDLAYSRGVQRFQIRRQLQQAHEKGYVPCGYPPVDGEKR